MVSNNPKNGESATIHQTPLPAELQNQIGQRLREVYIELVSEPVPDRFIQLLQELKSKEAQDQGEGSRE